MGCPCCGSTLGFWGSLASIAGLIASVWAAFAAGRAVAAARRARIAFAQLRLADVDLEALMDMLQRCSEHLASGVGGVRPFVEEAVAGAHALAEHTQLTHEYQRDFIYIRDALRRHLRPAAPGADATEAIAHDLDRCYNLVKRVQSHLVADIQGEP